MPNDSFDEIDSGFVGMNPKGENLIEQADQAMNPNPDDKLAALFMKTRIDPNVIPQVNHLLSKAIQAGKMPNLFPNGTKLNAADASLFADVLTSIAVEGESRKELIEIVGQAMPSRRGFLGGLFGRGNGGSYSDDIRG